MSEKLSIPKNKQQQIKQLRKWIHQSGCIIHSAIEIPAFFNGIQGIGTTQSLPHKTVIMAIPSKLVITVPRCYSDPQLKSLFKSCDELFDYQSDEDAQFNILCVFLMYHKLNIQKSPWKVYLKTIAQPETGVNWPDKDLAGLNKSVIQQILHVRQQCQKVEKKLCSFLIKTKQFRHLSYQKIIQLFRICYPTVLTRCFGYYFSTACMIPIADLMNHGCETIDHQLIHLNFEKNKQFNETYNPKNQKLDCEILGLPKPKNQSMPFRLKFLIQNNLIQNDLAALSQIKRHGIDKKIYDFLQKRIQQQTQQNPLQIQKLDFCEEEDKQDNDSDQDQQYGQTKSLQYIKAAEKEQMIQFRKYNLQVQKLGDVEKRIQQQQQKQNSQKQKNKAVVQNKNQAQITSQQKVELNQKQQSKQIQSLKIQTNETQNKQQNFQNKQIVQQNNSKESQKLRNQIFPIQDLCPIQCAEPSSSQSSCSQQQEWCLDQSCYFTMSTHTPVNAGQQLFNSYGSRTNKFLLVWYGFTYRNNLYDSVTLRLQANFPASMPKAKDIVLDTYVGGQGLCFKKNQQQYVQPHEVSRQFRLKRTRLPLQFLMFLRLLLVAYYEGKDNYKILSTVPSSFQFQIILMKYFKQIVLCLYQRYPIQIINALKKQQKQEETDRSRWYRIQFKIIYLQQQRKILDSNMEAVQAALAILHHLKQTRQFNKKCYDGLSMPTLRKVKQYLVQIKNSFTYILYDQSEKISQNQIKAQSKLTQTETETNLCDINTNTNDQDQWEDQN